MYKSIYKKLLILFAVIFLNNCSVSDFTDLWPTDAAENSEVVIREIPGESFDPEDTEEIEIVTGYNEENNEITIIDEISENEDRNLEFVSDETDISNNNLPEVAPIQTYVGDRISEMKNERLTK